MADKVSGDRLIYQVIVKEPASIDQLKSLSNYIAEDAKKKTQFRALTIFMNDYPEYIGSGATLGRVIFGPNGSYAIDASVKPGDYSKMSYSYELLQKDWSKRLTADEAKTWGMWWKYLQERRKANDTRTEEELRKEFARSTNIALEKLEQISLKQFTWTFNKMN